MGAYKTLGVTHRDEQNRIASAPVGSNAYAYIHHPLPIRQIRMMPQLYDALGLALVIMGILLIMYLLGSEDETWHNADG